MNWNTWKLRRVTCAGVWLAATALGSGCIPLMPPIGGLGGGAAAAPPSVTVSPQIYVVGQDGTLTIHPPADAQGSATSEPDGPDRTPRGQPDEAAPAEVGDAGSGPAPDPRLMLRVPSEETGDAQGPASRPAASTSSRSSTGSAPERAVAEPELAERLREAEGFCGMPCGEPAHIGYGHFLPLDAGSGDALLEYDISQATAAAERVAGGPLWERLTQRRRQVLTEIAFMSGGGGLGGFTEMLQALRAGDYARAADEIVDSDLQPVRRAVELAELMREG